MNIMDEHFSEELKRILVVDDEPNVRRMLIKGLEKLGYEVESAADGIEALEILNQKEIAVGIYDIMMPRMDGLELLAKTREIDPDIQVLIITAMSQMNMVIHALKQGAFAFIRKPFRLDEITHEVQNSLNHRRLTIANRRMRRFLEKLTDAQSEELRAYQTNLKLEKEKLENVLKSIGAGLQVVDKDGNITWANQIVKDWFGKIDNWSKVKHTGKFSISEPEHCFDCMVFKNRQSYNCEFVFTCKDNEVREFQLDCCPIEDPDGQVIQAVALIQDITERKNLERGLIHSERLVSMGEIASGLAHEINNPIGIILGLVQNIISEIDEKHPFYEDLIAVEEETLRTSNVVNSMLEFVHVPEFKKYEVFLPNIWRSSIQFLNYKLLKNQIKLTIDIEESLPELIGDPEQLRQVFINIILNSIYAMPQGGSLTVRMYKAVEKDDAGGNYIITEIADTGTGILPNELKNVFKPFYTSKGAGGTGLGLSICKRIVENHGGKINITSGEGKGTTCMIKLPI
ncbi:MAG: response regulator [FCB group bacterium]|nr:response regulator [FCB group bacterium]